MEIILAVIAGVALGVFTGIVITRGRSKDLLTEIEKLKWQLDNEKANAELRSSTLLHQVEAAKSDAKESIENIKLECEKRVYEVKNDAERQSREILIAQEERHRQALKAQQELFDETMSRVTAQVKSAKADMRKQHQSGTYREPSARDYRENEADNERQHT